MLRVVYRVGIAVLICAVAVGGLSLPGRAQPATWKVLVGADTPDHGLQGQDFYPRTITIKAGDTITWAKNVVLEHTVTFLSGATRPEIALPQPDRRLLFNPKVAFPQGGSSYDGTGVTSSGVIEESGKTYTLTFTTPGRYVYQCLLHPGMKGTVIVLGAGKAPMTQAQVDKAAADQWAASRAAGKQLLAAWKVSASGGVYTARLVGSQQSHLSLFRFTPGPLRVKAGSTVKWTMEDPYEIHTVTFQGPGTVPQFLVLEQQAQGPPKIWFNPKIVAPAGGPTHTGNAYYNSGILFPMSPPGPTSYTMKFTKPGTYTYWCVVHVPEGMRGSIIVQ